MGVPDPAELTYSMKFALLPTYLLTFTHYKKAEQSNRPPGPWNSLLV